MFIFTDNFESFVEKEQPKKLCCYFDLLGFSDSTKKATLITKKDLVSIKDFLNTVQTKLNKDGFEINITNYSDCFFITLESLSENYQPTLSSFVEFVSIIGMIQLFIFLETQNHFTLKGYLTYGSCTNTPDLVYGEALVECANKEKEIKEPRIEISKKAFDLFGLERNNFSNYELKNCILKVNDTLGTTIVDPFSSMNPEQQVASAELLSKLINRASKTEHAFKVLWLIACFVSHCDFSISTKDKTLLNDYSGLSRLLNTFN